MFNQQRFLQLIFIWIVNLILIISTLQAQQNLVVGNPANIFDVKSSFINPAILPFQSSHVMVGMKVFHFGFLENNKLAFRNNYFSISSPRILQEKTVVGITGQYFSLPIYDQSQFSLIIAHKIKNQFSIGIKYNLCSHSYDKTKFDQVDSWDPVFNQGTTKIFHSVGLGLFFFPFSDLSIGFAWDHINKPQISLINDGTRQPFIFDFGIRYSYKLLSTCINMNLIQKSPSFSWILETAFPDKGLFRVGYESNAAKLEGQLYLLKGIWINYSYDYPLYDLNDISLGSHQLSFIFDFDYDRNIPNKFSEPSIVEEKIDKKYFVSISSEQLKIITKKCKRSFHTNITKEKIDNLTDLEMGVLDSSENDVTFTDPDYHYHHVNNLIPKLSEQYKGYLQTLSKQLISDHKKKIQVIFNNKEDLKLINYFSPSVVNQIISTSIEKDTTTQCDLSVQGYEKEITLLFPQKAYFEIIGTRQKHHNYWKLEINDKWGKVINIFEGNGVVPSQIDWDWRDKNGNLLKADEYYYTLYWNDATENLQKTDRKSFHVVKIIRHMNTEITATPKQEIDSQRSKLIIKHIH